MLVPCRRAMIGVRRSISLDDVDETLGDGVASDNTAEDVNEDSSDLRIASDEVESRLDGLGSGTTTNIKEVGRAAAVELNDIHGGHSKTSTVNYNMLVSTRLPNRKYGHKPRHPISPSNLMKLRPCLVHRVIPRSLIIFRDWYFILSCPHFISILLGSISPREDLLLSKLGVVVETKLGIHSQNLVVRGL